MFGGDAQAAEGTHAYDLYEQGVRLGSLGLMFQVWQEADASPSLFADRECRCVPLSSVVFLGLLSFLA